MDSKCLFPVIIIIIFFILNINLYTGLSKKLYFINKYPQQFVNYNIFYYFIYLLNIKKFGININ